MGTGGVISFDVPQTSGSAAGIDYSLCPNGSNATSNPEVCVAEIDVGSANLTIASATPSDIHVTGTIPLRAQDIPVQVSFFSGCDPTIGISLDGGRVVPG